MNKDQFIAKIAEKSGLSKKDAGACLDATLETLESELGNGGSVTFVGFGTFEVRERAARTGRNPRTKETIEIPATRVPNFRPGKALKDAVK